MSVSLFLSNLLYATLDIITAPRQTEQKVRLMTAEELYEIAAREKDPAYLPEIRTLLPYRNAAVKALEASTAAGVQNPH